jgi:hypothetical protein
VDLTTPTTLSDVLVRDVGLEAASGGMMGMQMASPDMKPAPVTALVLTVQGSSDEGNSWSSLASASVTGVDPTHPLYTPGQYVHFAIPAGTPPLSGVRITGGVMNSSRPVALRWLSQVSLFAP